MMMLWPSDAAICSATARAMTSEVPPAANGTIMVIGRLGKSCACAVTAVKAATAAAAMILNTIALTPRVPVARRGRQTARARRCSP
jgi:hypothetical protein